MTRNSTKSPMEARGLPLPVFIGVGTMKIYVRVSLRGKGPKLRPFVSLEAARQFLVNVAMNANIGEAFEVFEGKPMENGKSHRATVIPAGHNPLQHYLKQFGISPTAFARLVNRSPSTITRICKGEIEPNRDTKKRIEKATGGRVPTNAKYVH